MSDDSPSDERIGFHGQDGTELAQVSELGTSLMRNMLVASMERAASYEELMAIWDRYFVHCVKHLSKAEVAGLVKRFRSLGAKLLGEEPGEG